MADQPLLAIPPFPGARPVVFAKPGGSARCDTHRVMAALARERVGGCYWGRQSDPQVGGYRLDGARVPQADAVALKAADDPWFLLGKAVAARFEEQDPRALLALAAGLPVALVGSDGAERAADPADAERLVAQHLAPWRWFDPFDGREIDVFEAIALCGFWRRLIDANRTIGSVLGIAYWKKPTVSALLWGGAPVPYGRRIDALPEGAAVAVWQSRLAASEARAIRAHGPRLAEIEDGFLRSAGLGADCVPPLSIILDMRGAHFDPSRPSDLEHLLEYGDFPSDLVMRARALRQQVVASGLSKYEAGGRIILDRPGGNRRHVLVPGQVEDDRAVTSGGALPSNLELLARARAEAGPDAYLIYKPHPDVLAGHRRGAIPPDRMSALADRIETAAPMAALIDMVDELHVNTSLSGFEALMREKPVTVHGVPFYAGWGLTVDRGPVPARRTARRSLDELVAAALLLYPRYLDPETGLPCEAEILARRLASGLAPLRPAARAVVAVRRAAGRINRLARTT